MPSIHLTLEAESEKNGNEQRELWITMWGKKEIAVWGSSNKYAPANEENLIYLRC